MSLPKLSCFSTLGCPHATVAEVCELAQRHHISQIELRSLEGQVDYPAFLAGHPDKLAELKGALAASRLAIPVLGSSLHLVSGKAPETASFLASCKIARELDAPYVRVFGGGPNGRLLTPEEIRTAAATYRECAARLEEIAPACSVIVETHGGMVTGGKTAEFWDALGKRTPMIWDTHHTWKLGGEALEETAAVLGSAVRHIHCKDSKSDPASSRGYTYVLPLQGEFPFASLIPLLDAMPSALLSLEWEKQWHPYLAPLEAALAAWEAA